MAKAGGIIGLIAGILAVFAAGITLLMGGVATGLESEGASTVVGLGWGGLAASFLTIVLSAIAMGSSSKVPGALMIVTALVGAIFGGTLVAIFMILAFIAGILVVIGAKKKPMVAAV